MRRKTYHASELRAGHTLYIVTSTLTDRASPPIYGMPTHIEGVDSVHPRQIPKRLA